MIFASMSITKTAAIDKSREFFGKRIAVYSYDTYMHAYIDMSALSEDDISFDDKAGTVHITLPPIVTEISGRDMELRKEYDNIGLFRDSIDARERAELKELANTSLKKELQDNKAFTSQMQQSIRHDNTSNHFSVKKDTQPSLTSNHSETYTYDKDSSPLTMGNNHIGNSSRCLLYDQPQQRAIPHKPRSRQRH